MPTSSADSAEKPTFPGLSVYKTAGNIKSLVINALVRSGASDGSEHKQQPSHVRGLYWQKPTNASTSPPLGLPSDNESWFVPTSVTKQTIDEGLKGTLMIRSKSAVDGTDKNEPFRVSARYFAPDPGTSGPHILSVRSTDPRYNATSNDVTSTLGREDQVIPQSGYPNGRLYTAIYHLQHPPIPHTERLGNTQFTLWRLGRLARPPQPSSST